MKTDSSLLYFAYGSNLNKEQMRKRCPDSGEISAAVLPEYRLVQRYYADIEPAPGENVYGAVYRISPEDLENLDRYEGFPDSYIRIETVVCTPDGRKLQAIVYRMTPEYRELRNGPCTVRYRAICSAGADAWGIPNAFGEKKAQEKDLNA